MPDITDPATMRATLDATFAGEIDRQIAPLLWLTLERAAHCWRMTLASGDGPIPHATCDRVATAVSAPAWAVRSVADALASMGRGMAGLVRAEDAATVDAWLAERGATVLAVGA